MVELIVVVVPEHDLDLLLLFFNCKPRILFVSHGIAGVLKCSIIFGRLPMNLSS